MGWHRGLLAAGAALALLLPADSPAEEPPPLDPTPFLGKDWYGAYLFGQKAGFAEVTASLATRGETPVVVVEARVTLRMKVGQEEVEMRLVMSDAYRAAGRQELLESRFLESSAAESVERVGTREKDGFIIRTYQGKEESERETVPLPRETLSDFFCAESLAATGAKPGTKRTVPSFDVEDGKEGENSYEAIGFEEGFSSGIRSRIVVVRHISEDGESATLRYSSQGKLLEGEFAGVGQIRLEPEVLAKDLSYAADLSTRGFLHIGTKLGDPGDVRLLTLRLRGADPALDLPSDGRQSARREEDGAILINLRYEVPRRELPAVTEIESADALRSTSEYPCTNTEIRALARQAAGDASTTEEKVWRLIAFVDDYVVDADCTTSVSALDVLRNRKGDCSEHTLLFIALCRCLGIPAREVGGLMYAGDQLGAFGGHAWAELALEGRWVSADPTWGQFPVDATHIKLDEGDKAENSLRMMKGGMKAEVVSVERKK